MHTKDAQIGIRISAALRKRLQTLANDDKRSLSSYIANVLEKHAEDARAKKP